ncbi:MAG: lipopolysaccharide biosynthesis protein [Gammaproteobacteria bacterium]
MPLLNHLHRGRRALSDFTWIFGGRIVAALATVVGIRAITELMSPSAYGAGALALGISATFLAIGSTPFLQAIARLHPEAVARASEQSLELANRRILGRAQLGVAVAGATLALCLLAVDSPHGAMAAFIGVLAAIESRRDERAMLLNVSRRHRAQAVLSASDAILRLACAVLFLHLFVPTAEFLLLGYAAGTLFATLLATRPPRPHTADAAVEGAPPWDCRAEILRFAAPLVPTGILSCILAFGDRYILAGMLDLHDVGIYAAAYGLVSRSFGMVQSSWELAIRPRFMKAVAEGDHDAARKGFRRLLIGTLLLAGGLAIVFVMVREWITGLLLATTFAPAADLMGWFAFGLFVRAISSCYLLILFAYKRTRMVLLVTAASSTLSVAAVVLGAQLGGLVGAAAACPVYFALELSILLAVTRGIQVRRQD